MTSSIERFIIESKAFFTTTYFSVVEIYMKNIDRKYGNNIATINLY